MIKLIRNLPINRKLLLILLFSSVTSLLFAGVLLVVLEISEFQRATSDDLSAFAKIVGNRSSAALLFEDKNLAQENLAVLHTLPAVQVSCLYDAHSVVFAELHKNEQKPWNCPALIKAEKTHFEFGHLAVIQPIIEDGAEIGTVYIHADLSGRKVKTQMN